MLVFPFSFAVSVFCSRCCFLADRALKINLTGPLGAENTVALVLRCLPSLAAAISVEQLADW